ncbi:hypothetical protein GLOIN_2v1523879 [Rhizophagus irregularis DAOM 181602=DAOM 197198]|uniref:Uncharacterized protein n=1 Tax=Rhizophagus irregularis (strain DAOM 181602 / DAOM 197198 / MUCL 43194) TaxID=747089 RepID=A0A2P4QQF6_RHIID|nr:hypothetical protein GLOIN_2v1523879 [Rhizophagus irregularis DAOM 181602=DAOM 197198]POG79889.1 hypothetical protein GLOIN_2v1523879 [Rhizophagus irregularis DAOM 181602=DAOM 197198]|eukprot:XP_025186755.1 hypothetical protein GLOIN_2v1523879 [Rhizophagus irregularis DAOM 181602=DAOM 197198]
MKYFPIDKRNSKDPSIRLELLIHTKVDLQKGMNIMIVYYILENIKLLIKHPY